MISLRTTPTLCMITVSLLLLGCPKKTFVPDISVADTVTIAAPTFLLSNLIKPLDTKRYLHVDTRTHGSIDIYFDPFSNGRKNELQIKGEGMYLDIFKDPERPLTRYMVATAIICPTEQGRIDYDNCANYSKNNPEELSREDGRWLFSQVGSILESIDESLRER